MKDTSFPSAAPFETKAGPRTAVVQMTSTEDVRGNLARVEELVTRAAEAGARLVALPENFAYLGAGADHRLSLAEDLEGAPGPIRGRMQRIAARCCVWLLLGGMPERRSGIDRVANASVLLDSHGDTVAVYRKMHLFDVDVPGGRSFRESAQIEPGAEPVLADTPWGALGLTICYDLRFPELYRDLTARGARMLAVPSAFTSATGRDHWHVLLRARAIENQAFVLAPAQAGRHGGDRESFGHALIVDPWGRVLAEQPTSDGEGIAVADLDYAAQDGIRARMPVLRHRRL